MEASLHGHGWLNHWPLVIELNLWPFSPPWKSARSSNPLITFYPHQSSLTVPLCRSLQKPLTPNTHTSLQWFTFAPPASPSIYRMELVLLVLCLLMVSRTSGIPWPWRLPRPPGYLGTGIAGFPETLGTLAVQFFQAHMGLCGVQKPVRTLWARVPSRLDKPAKSSISSIPCPPTTSLSTLLNFLLGPAHLSLSFLAILFLVVLLP